MATRLNQQRSIPLFSNAQVLTRHCTSSCFFAFATKVNTSTTVCCSHQSPDNRNGYGGNRRQRNNERTSTDLWTTDCLESSFCAHQAHVCFVEFSHRYHASSSYFFHPSFYPYAISFALPQEGGLFLFCPYDPCRSTIS